MRRRVALPYLLHIEEGMQFDQFQFDISDAARSLGIKAICFVIEGVRNQQTHPEFEAFRSQTLAETAKDLSPEVFETDPILIGFRDLHDAIRRSNRKNVASPESLLKLVLKTGGLPQVNLLVDIYNLMSVKTRLSLGAHDLTAINGNVHLRLTDGSETFWPMGSEKPKVVSPDEYAYIDDGGDVLCRLEVRQCDKTKITLDTTAGFFIVQGNANTPDDYLHEATNELLSLIKQFCGGEGRMLE